MTKSLGAESTRRSFLRSTSLGAVAILGDGIISTSKPVGANEEWTKGLGRYKTVFDVSDFAPYPGLGAIRRVIEGYRDEVGVSGRDLGIVIVVRRRAAGMAVSASEWQKYRIGDDILQLKLQDPAGFSRNPFYEELARLQQNGAVVLVCRVALRELADEISRRRSISREEMRGTIGQSLLPGAIVVANGIFALARAQSVGCGFISCQ
jgi:hypothetical protein